MLPFAIALSGTACAPEEGERIEQRSEAITWGIPRGPQNDYLFVTGPQNQATADYFCFLNGGHLAIINNSLENTFILNQLAAHGGGQWWIGYNDIDVEGLWKWPDGTSNGYVNWQAGQPANVTGGEDCAVMDFTANKWIATACGAEKNYVCERTTNNSVSTGSFSFNVSNTNYALQNYASFAVHVHFGVTMGTCGVPGSSQNGDTFLRFVNQNGVEVAGNDDACGTSGLGSNLTYDTRACPDGCTYVIHAGCFSSASCSGVVSFQQE